MKKIIILLVAVLTCLTAVFAGCGDSTGYENKLSGFEGEVSSNGGFVVQKGSYVYFINGTETHTTDNTYGKVEMGALVRVKADDLSNPEIVIPSLFVAGDKTSGFYIFGEEVYYATPSTAKNKAGEIENSKLAFTKTSLDGKTSNVIITVDDNTTQYRFVESNGEVYLVLKTVNEDGETVIKVISTKTKEVIVETQKVESVTFADDASEYVYYTVTAHDEELDKDEAFNELWRVKLDGTKEKLLDGKNFGVSGAKIAVIKETKDNLFLSLTYVDTSVTTVTNYYGIAKASISAANVESNQGEALVLLNNGSKSASTIFSATSWYRSLDSIVYLDKTYGLIEYNYTDTTLPEGRKLIGYGKDLITYTVKFWQQEEVNDEAVMYLYLTDSSNYYYKVNVSALLETSSNEVEPERITLNAIASWYTPEVVNGYFFATYSAEPYTALVFAVKNEALSEEDIDAFAELEGEEQIEEVLKDCISFKSQAVKDAIKAYEEENFDVEDHSGHNHG